MRQRYLTVTTVFILGALSLGLLIWTDQIRQRQRMQFAFADALANIQGSVLTSQLLLYERVGDGGTSQIERAWSNLDKALTASDLLLSGGISAYGVTLVPLKDPDLQRRATNINRLLSTLIKNSRELHREGETAASGLILDRRSDEISGDIIRDTKQLESIMERRGVADDAESTRLIFWILSVWFLLVSASTAAVFSRERARKRVDDMLRRTNDELEIKVAERTRELKALTDEIQAHSINLTAANEALQNEVCERTDAEEALRESEERHRTLIETMNEGLMVIDNQGVLTYVNEKFCELLGYSRNEILGRQYGEFLSEADAQMLAGQVCLVDRHQSRQQDIKKLRREIAFKNSNGEKIFTIVSPRAVHDKDHKMVGYFAVITDITQKVALQAATMRASHMVSLGEVAAGVAHEINNPLNGIINYARILCDQSGADDIPNRIVKEGRRIAEIVKALLLFAHGGTKEKKLVEVKEILSDSLGLMESEMKHEGVQIRTSVAADLPGIQADPQEIQQVFMNTISNARYALNQKYSGPHEDKRLEIRVERSINSAYVRIAFRDSGVGIPAEIIDKIREPFFSTKPRGQGTGLGLSISDGIIRDHRGELTIESVEGEFTNIIIDLPTGEAVYGQHSSY